MATVIAYSSTDTTVILEQDGVYLLRDHCPPLEVKETQDNTGGTPWVVDNTVFDQWHQLALRGEPNYRELFVP